MLPKILLATTLAAVLAAGTTGIAYAVQHEAPAAQPPAASLATPPPTLDVRPFNLTWDGYYKLGLADCAMLVCPAHTYETEPIVAPLAKAGFRVDIPADTRTLEFEIRWKSDERLHLMVHAPMKPDHSMPSYMAMGGKPGRLCIAVPATEIVAGMWEIMAHAGSMGVQDTPFTVLVNGEAPTPAKLRAGPHGHPTDEDWSMESRPAAACRVAP
jgi:hypothetical protein